MSDNSSGVVVGVVVSVCVVVVIFIAVGVWWWLKKRRQGRNGRNTQATKLDQAFQNVAFTNTENPPPPKPPNANLSAPPGGLNNSGYAPTAATRQSNMMTAPPPASANQSGYSYKATKPQYTAPPPAAPAAAAAAPASSRQPAQRTHYQPAGAKGATESLAQRPGPTTAVGVEANRSGGQASKDSGLASTSLHSGGSIDDEEVAPYSMFAAGLLTDATSTSARAILPGQEHGGAGGGQGVQGGTMGARQVALAANGPASKHTLGMAVENAQSYSPTIGKRPPSMSPPQGYVTMEKVMPPGPAVVPVYYAVPVKRPYGHTGIDSRPDPYAAARRATVERLSARAKRVKQLNSDMDSSSPEMDGGGSVSITFDASVASSTDVSKASNNFDFEDPENRLPSKKVRFTTPEEPEKPHKRQLSARYRGRAPPGRFPGLNAQQSAAAAAAGLGDAFTRVGSSEMRRRGGRPPTGRQATPNSSVVGSSNSLDMSLVAGSASAVNTSLPTTTESKQPPPLDTQPKKSILRREGSSDSLNRSRDSRRRRAASDDGSFNASRSSFAGRAMSADVESARIPLGAAPAPKRTTSPPEVHVAMEAPKPAGRKPATKHLPAGNKPGSPTNSNAPSQLSPPLTQPSVESDV